MKNLLFIMRIHIIQLINFTKLKKLFLLMYTKRTFGVSINCRMQSISSKSCLCLDIVVPAIEKDLVTLPLVIDSVKLNIKHPVNKIYIVSPQSKKIKNLCSEKGCVFIDERKVVPFPKSEIDYKVGKWDRAGWMYQQFIKMSSDNICEKEYFLVLDADTIFLRPQVFEEDGKIVFDISDEYNRPYFDMYERIFGTKHKAKISFVSHHMLMQKSILKELKEQIEKKDQDKWYNTILKNLDKKEVSGFSEYESYGNFMLEHYPEKMILEYWRNKQTSRMSMDRLGLLMSTCPKYYKTLSLHDYA